MTQKMLAQELNIDPGTLGRWERGEVNPSGSLKARPEEFVRSHSLTEVANEK